MKKVIKGAKKLLGHGLDPILKCKIVHSLQGMAINGFVNVIITTLERRFGLSSTETGVIAGSYDIGSMISVIPISYFGAKLGTSKPKYVQFTARLIIFTLILIIFFRQIEIPSRKTVDFTEILQNKISYLF